MGAIVRQAQFLFARAAMELVWFWVEEGQGNIGFFVQVAANVRRMILNEAQLPAKLPQETDFDLFAHIDLLGILHSLAQESHLFTPRASYNSI